MSVLGQLHDHFIFSRRSRVLAKRLGEMIPAGSRVLDVGCGDGLIDRMIMDEKGASIEGIDTLLRPTTHIPVRKFDGVNIPSPDQSADVVMFVDVLHHTEDPNVLLAEAARVGKHVLIKDHLRHGFLANETLRVMDWVGNARHGVVLPYNYLSRPEWDYAFYKAGLQVDRLETELGLYPIPIAWVFGRSLHFIASCTSVAT
jgi:SAM-dependent methyltransferase